MQTFDLSVVMPAYREAASLTNLLPTLLQALSQLTPNFQVIVSDSMEPLDNTAEVCSQFGVRHMHRTGGNTYGDAVRSGIQASSGRYVLLMDADGSHNPKDIPFLWEKREPWDIVIGSRYVQGGSTENPAALIAMSRALNYLYKFAFNLPVNDISNSFRLYHGDPLRGLQLQSKDFDVVEEILIRLVFGSTKARVTEVPVTFEQRKAGESKRNLPAFMLSYLKSIRNMRRFRSSELNLAKMNKERA